MMRFFTKIGAFCGSAGKGGILGGSERVIFCAWAAFCCERSSSSLREGILLFILNREYSSIHSQQQTQHFAPNSIILSHTLLKRDRLIRPSFSNASTTPSISPSLTNITFPRSSNTTVTRPSLSNNSNARLNSYNSHHSNTLTSFDTPNSHDNSSNTHTFLLSNALNNALNRLSSSNSDVFTSSPSLSTLISDSHFLYSSSSSRARSSANTRARSSSSSSFFLRSSSRLRSSSIRSSSRAFLNSRSYSSCAFFSARSFFFSAFASAFFPSFVCFPCSCCLG